MAKNKFTRVAGVWQGAKGPYVTLGSTKNKDPQYNLHVEVTVTNEDGEVVASSKNGILTSLDPRKSKFAGERTIPENLLAELFIVAE